MAEDFISESNAGNCSPMKVLFIDIRKAKASADYVIVVYHGGKEYSRYPSPRLYKACHEMVKCGADVVLCQHSHIIGAYEKINGWREYVATVEEPYKKFAGFTVESTSTDYQMFAHYLDCEAHTDIWRELFKTWNHTNELD